MSVTITIPSHVEFDALVAAHDVMQKQVAKLAAELQEIRQTISGAAAAAKVPPPLFTEKEIKALKPQQQQETTNAAKVIESMTQPAVTVPAADAKPATHEDLIKAFQEYRGKTSLQAAKDLLTKLTGNPILSIKQVPVTDLARVLAGVKAALS